MERRSTRDYPIASAKLRMAFRQCSSARNHSGATRLTRPTCVAASLFARPRATEHGVRRADSCSRRRGLLDRSACTGRLLCTGGDARRTTQRSARRSCWNGRFWSAVTNTSNPAASAARRSAPFDRPAQPCCWTVLTSCPDSADASCRGNCSSSSTRTVDQRFVSQFQGGNHLLA